MSSACFLASWVGEVGALAVERVGFLPLFLLFGFVKKPSWEALSDSDSSELPGSMLLFNDHSYDHPMIYKFSYRVLILIYKVSRFCGDSISRFKNQC